MTWRYYSGVQGVMRWLERQVATGGGGAIDVVCDVSSLFHKNRVVRVDLLVHWYIHHVLYFVFI